MFEIPYSKATRWLFVSCKELSHKARHTAKSAKTHYPTTQMVKDNVVFMLDNNFFLESAINSSQEIS